MINDLKQKKKKISVLGLGYVGLPVALAFAKKFAVIGFDVNREKIDQLKLGVDPSKELHTEDFENTDIFFTSNSEDLKMANFHIVAVPTPVNNAKVPNLDYLRSASLAVSNNLHSGDIVVYESTVYPGCTEEECLPILEKSGLKLGLDFKIGYSPERINPGDKKHTLSKIVKVVSASDEDALEVISAVYGSIIDAGIFKAESIKVAEAAKVIENTQRDLNIALMNELSIIFDKMDINTQAVLQAAGTKWNFLNFYPGLVGGHCIGVDPYYLTYKSEQIGYSPKVILSGRAVNDYMPAYVAKKMVKALSKKHKNLVDAMVLIMGITFKENVSDIRNSKVADLAFELQSYSINVDICDPHANADEVKAEYGLSLINELNEPYDAIIIAVPHEEYKSRDISSFLNLMNGDPIVFDLKAILNSSEINDFHYWSL